MSFLASAGHLSHHSEHGVDFIQNLKHCEFRIRAWTDLQLITLSTYIKKGVIINFKHPSASKLILVLGPAEHQLNNPSLFWR